MKAILGGLALAWLAQVAQAAPVAWVQYDAAGCPKLFTGVQATFPIQHR